MCQDEFRSATSYNSPAAASRYSRSTISGTRYHPRPSACRSRVPGIAQWPSGGEAATCPTYAPTTGWQRLFLPRVCRRTRCPIYPYTSRAACGARSPGAELPTLARPLWDPGLGYSGPGAFCWSACRSTLRQKDRRIHPGLKAGTGCVYSSMGTVISASVVAEALRLRCREQGSFAALESCAHLPPASRGLETVPEWSIWRLPAGLLFYRWPKTESRPSDTASKDSSS